MGILQLIANRNYITLNKDLIKLVGLEEAILLGELASEYDYWEKQDALEDGYFYTTIENVQNNTTLSDYQQRRILKKLQEVGLVDVKVRGIPAKRYIKINEEQVIELFDSQLLKNLISSSQKIKELDVKKLKGNNNINNKNNNKNKNKNKNNIIREKPKFIPPSLDEVREYCISRNNNVDAKTFFDYYEAGEWKDAKGNKVKNWKQKVITWEKRSNNNASSNNSGNPFMDIAREEGII